MTEEQKRRKQTFLEPETRDGYFIDANMKAAWKVMLDIVEQFSRICAKYNLNYSLAGGTLLGAIRHGGFIPWDDDIDIDMPRPDYDRFIKIVSEGSELVHPLYLQTPFNDWGYASRYIKIRNVQTASIDPGYAQSGLCHNMGIGVDIFPIDGVPISKVSKLVTKTVSRVTTSVLARSSMPYRNRRVKDWVMFLFASTVCGVVGRRNIWRVREWAYSRNSLSECHICGEFSFLPDSKKERWSPSVYESYKEVPFEYLDLKVPSGYEEVLTAKYGRDWRKPVKASAYHRAHIFDASHSYKDILVGQFGYAPEWLKKLP